MSYQIELRHLRYFLAVAEELHFNKAAEQLYISQPALSKQIKQLEEELGFKLFERHNRKVELTIAGEYLQNEFKEQLDKMQQCIQFAKQLQEGVEGSLKFGHVGSAMQDVIPKFLLAIRKRYPKIHFDLKEMDNPKQIEAIRSHQIDFGFVRMDEVPSDIEMHPVYEDTFSLVLPMDHPINGHNFSHLKQLKEEAFILFDATYSESYYKKVMQIFEDSGFQPIVSHKTVHANTIYSLVENHFGISIVPSSLKKGYDMNIRFIELFALKQRTSLNMIWSKKNKNPVLNNVMDLVSSLHTL